MLEEILSYYLKIYNRYIIYENLCHNMIVCKTNLIHVKTLKWLFQDIEQVIIYMNLVKFATVIRHALHIFFEETFDLYF